jgi:hypothetical protein
VDDVARCEYIALSERGCYVTREVIFRDEGDDSFLSEFTGKNPSLFEAISACTEQGHNDLDCGDSVFLLLVQGVDGVPSSFLVIIVTNARAGHTPSPDSEPQDESRIRSGGLMIVVVKSFSLLPS